ncbi:MAG: hypothetical protein WB440_19370 [Steroidobacteraceae bacterium]|jgi:hypothetical protein
MRVIIILLLLIAGGAAAWTWLSLEWSYSDGERAGVLQKYSHRGWLCKTGEGELAQYVVPGLAPVFWEFSVRDAAISEQLNKAVGHKVQVHYTEHRGVPSSCFGDTTYFADRVLLEDDPPAAAAAVPAAAPAAVPPAAGGSLPSGPGAPH